MSSLNAWKIIGIIALTLLGFVIHYVFDWTNHSNLIGLFVPVNESVWEHLKLGYGALVIYTLFEYFFVSTRVNNYFLAKLTGIFVLETTILVIFYGYKIFTAKNILFLDITSYIIGVILCQTVIHRLYALKPYHDFIHKISLITFISIGLLFGLLTYYPPHQSIFMEHKSGTYGILREK